MLHRDHLEVYNKFGDIEMVLNLDGKINVIKTDIAHKKGRNIRRIIR